MSRSKGHPWLNRFAWLTAAATFLLIGLGGLVTSKEAGMSVPDWPTSYGYNMFLFPFRLWTPGNGIFYEHTHRLLASMVGLLTTILAIWLWLRESRPWLRWLGVGAFFAVVLQGVLGGLRVTLYKDQIGIFHAMLAQAFFVTVTLIAVFLTGLGDKLVEEARRQAVSARLRSWILSATALIGAQLILGATMRHQHAGLAVPDFPLAYGQIWPRLDSAFVQSVNQRRLDSRDFKPITSFQIGLHMAHRIGALMTLVAIGAAALMARGQQGKGSFWARFTGAWFGLICLQALLGAVTVWSNKAADVATAHVLVGALSLLTGSALSLAVVWSRRTGPSPVHDPAPSGLSLMPSAQLVQSKLTSS